MKQSFLLSFQGGPGDNGLAGSLGTQGETVRITCPCICKNSINDTTSLVLLARDVFQNGYNITMTNISGRERRCWSQGTRRISGPNGESYFTISSLITCHLSINHLFIYLFIYLFTLICAGSCGEQRTAGIGGSARNKSEYNVNIKICKRIPENLLFFSQ